MVRQNKSNPRNTSKDSKRLSIVVIRFLVIVSPINLFLYPP